MQPDGDLVLDVVLFLWGKMKVVMRRDQLQSLEFTYYLEKVDNYNKVCIWKGNHYWNRWLFDGFTVLYCH